jgi:hypothetical protein
LTEGADTNRDGGGIAWIEKGRVRWEKGVDIWRILDLVKTVPLPFVIHFRMGTVGSKSGELCHPFPIEQKVPLDTKGKADAVLAHNGHWSDWQFICKKMLQPPRPKGEWSDSRAMARLAAIYGEKVLAMLPDQRIATLSKTGITLYGKGWEKFRGVWVSNTYSFLGSAVVQTGYEHWRGGDWIRGKRQRSTRTANFEPVLTEQEWDEIQAAWDRGTDLSEMTLDADSSPLPELTAVDGEAVEEGGSEALTTTNEVQRVEGERASLSELEKHLQALDGPGSVAGLMAFPVERIEWQGMQYVRARSGGWLQVGPQQLKTLLKQGIEKIVGVKKGG